MTHVSYRVAVAVLVLIAASSAFDLQAQPVGAPPLPPPGKLIDVGGWKLHLYCTGVARPNQPTIVLEAGVGAFSVEWSLTQPLMAENGRVCSYDRAGSGWSEWGPHPRTMRQIVYELHTLLSRSGESAPYVLVGASYGGWIARLYQHTYPTEVVGMVLVDAGATDPARLMPDGTVVPSSAMNRGRPVPEVKTAGPLRQADIPEAALAQIRAGLAAASARANEPPRDRLPLEAQRMRSWGLGQIGHVVAAVNPFEAEELAYLRDINSKEAPLGALPLIVLTRGRSDEVGAEAEAQEKEHRADQARQAAFSRNSRHHVVEGSGHHIAIDNPGVVARAIGELLAMPRSRLTLACPRLRRMAT